MNCDGNCLDCLYLNNDFDCIRMKDRFMINPSDDRFGEMLNYAVRYALGRQSYAPHDVVNYITPLLPRLSHRTLFVMAKDIEKTDSYGDERIDKPMWLKFLAEVKKHLNNKTADFVEVNKMIEQ